MEEKIKVDDVRNQFTLTKKFLLIAILYFIPLLYLSYYMFTEHREIQFSETELKGNKYQKALRALFEDVSRSMVLNHQFLIGELLDKNQITLLQEKIDQDFIYLMAIDQELGKELSTSEQDFIQRNEKNVSPSILKNNWNVLRQQMFTIDPKTSENFHTQLLNEISALISHVGDTSQLILDPDIDTYYIMDSTLLKIPSLQLQLPQLVLLAKKIIEKGEISDEEKADLIVRLVLLKNSINATKEGIQKSYVYDKFYHDKETEDALQNDLNEYYDSVQNLINYIEEKFINSNAPPKTSTELKTISLKAIDESYQFWDKAIIQLDRLLEKRATYYRVQQFIIIIIVVVIPICIIVFLALRNIGQPLNRLIAATRQLGTGDLSVRIAISRGGPVRDIANSFNHMVEFLQQVILHMKKSTIHLTSTSTEIATAAKEQEATVTEQEATAKEISMTTQKIYETAKNLSDSMADVNKMAETTSSLANSGKEGLTLIVAIMQKMVEATNSIASKLAIINEKAGNITGVITTISKVADQTNLLSLNAAIEAEKAGEHGRSFAVIAREIRRLADQTAASTDQIEKMVNEMSSAVSSGVMGVDKFSEEIRVGVNQVRVVSEQLSRIITQVEKQSTSIESVNDGMQRQTQSAQQITEAISQLSDATLHTANSTRKFNSVIAQMNISTRELQSAVESISHGK